MANVTDAANTTTAAMATTEPLMWAGLIGVSLARGIGGNTAFTSASVLLNERLTRDIGYYNGLATSMSSLARALGPTMCGTIFAASLRLPFPFDFHLAFYFLMVVGGVTLALTFRFRGK